ncbi:MAG: hypothetical protein ABEH58_03995 [Haloplanus sp.]
MRTPRRPLVVLFLLVLIALLVGYGTVTPDPAAGRFFDNDALADGTLAPGDRVAVSGTARGDASGGTRLDLDDGPTVAVRGLDAAPGADVWLYGTYRGRETIRTNRAVVRAPWEITYLYAVSALGGLLTLGRAIRTWRFDAAEWAFVPREKRDG